MSFKIDYFPWKLVDFSLHSKVKCFGILCIKHGQQVLLSSGVEKYTINSKISLLV